MSQLVLNHQRINMDMVDFDPIEEVEEDYNLEDFFLKRILHPLQPLIEYRIKLVLKNDTRFLAGEKQVINTSCIIRRKSTPKLSMFLSPYENLPLSFESGGYISRNYSGRVVLKLTNYCAQSIKLNSGTPVGYIVMQHFSLE